MKSLLEIKNLQTSFKTEDGTVRAVDSVSFSIEPGEVVGLVGESGCGKTAVSLSILQLLPVPPAVIEGGEIIFDGENLLSYSSEKIRKIRGNKIAMIFQEPMTSLNPVYTIGNQLLETIQLHQQLDLRAAQKRAVEMLKLVGIPRADEILTEYPHQFSGGMRQRVMIAMALSCNPRLLIADEPTTALDVTIQAQILELMKELQDRIGMSILFITHDLSVIAEMADRVVVMYAGKLVEQASVQSLFHNPFHPYTKGLIGSRPSTDKDISDSEDRTRLPFIPGSVPNPLQMPSGCPFHPRCSHVMDICMHQMPQGKEVAQGDHEVKCWLYNQTSSPGEVQA